MAHQRTFIASILFILLVVLFLQWYFFIGMAGQYGEESLFIGWALNGSSPTWSYSDLFRPLRAITDWTSYEGDPSGMYAFRIAALYPNLLFVRWLGSHEAVLCIWTLLTGVLSIPVVIAIGERLHSRLAGIIAGIVVALTPGRLIYTSRIDTDMPQFLFLSLATYCVVRAYQAMALPSISRWALLAGMCTGLLYLSKLTLGLFTLAMILGLSLVSVSLLYFGLIKSSMQYQHGLRVSAYALLGFLGIFFLENVFYYCLTGHWLLHWHMMQGNARNIPSWRAQTFNDFGILRIWDSPSGISWLTEHSRVLFRHVSILIYNLAVHGWIGWAVVASTATAVIFRSRRKNSGLTVMVLLGFAAYYLYNEFFWYYPTLEQGFLNLTPIHKVHRFIFPCYIGAALLVGIACARLADYVTTARTHRAYWFECGMAIVVAVVYGMGSVDATQTIIPRLRSSYAHFRSIGGFLRSEVPPGSRVFFPGYSPVVLEVVTAPSSYEWAQVPFQDSARAPCGGWAVVVNNFGIGFSPDVIDSVYPSEIKQFFDDPSNPPFHSKVAWSETRNDPTNQKVFSSVLKLPDC